MGHDLNGRQIKPGTDTPDKFDLRCIAGEALSQYDVCYISGVSGEYLVLSLADKDSLAKARGPLFMCKSNVPSGGAFRATQFGSIRDLDTSAATVGDPVYLSDDGAVSLTAAGAKRRVGTVSKVGASGTGRVQFDGGAFPAVSMVIGGTAEIANGQSTVTVAAATLGGSYGGKPVVACFNETDGTKYIVSCTWSTDDLVITASAAVGADRTVAYLILLD